MCAHAVLLNVVCAVVVIIHHVGAARVQQERWQLTMHASKVLLQRVMQPIETHYKT
jgi:hypothetical protein